MAGAAGLPPPPPGDLVIRPAALTMPRLSGLPGRLAAIAAFGLLASACAAVPEPATLGFAVPARYEAKAGAPAAAPQRWWARFGAGELNRLVDAAEIGSLDMAASLARIAQADAQARIAGAGLFPTVDFDASGSRSRSAGNQRNSVSGVLSASYILDVWGRQRDILAAAQRDAETARYAAETVRLATLASVATAYFDLAAARERLSIADQNVANAERILRIVRERLAAGTGTALDVAQQESFLANQRAAIPPLRQTAEQARTLLALLIGRPPQGFKVAAGSLKGITVPAIAAGIPSALLVRRPDIRSAEAQLAAADASVEAARKALLPTISLTGSAGYQSSALSSLLRPESAIWSLAGGLAQPIFDGNRLRSQVDLSIAQRQELLELYRRSILNGLTDVENALIFVRESAASEATQRVVVAKAREAFDLSEDRLKQGTIDLVTLLNTQATLSNAQDGLVQARLQRLRAAVTLIQALGGDWSAKLAPARSAENPS